MSITSRGDGVKDLREPIIMVQRLGVVTFSGTLTERQVEVFSRHLRAAYEELKRPNDTRPSPSHARGERGGT